MVLACSTGAGVVTASTPSPVPLPPYTAAVAVDWTTTQSTMKLEPSLQVVSHHLLWRDSPIHDQSWASLRMLNVTNARLATWFPYPKAGVAEVCVCVACFCD